MNVDTLAAGSAPRAGWHSWMAGGAMLIGLAAFAALFWEEGEAAIRVWIASTAYSHCFFVLPIAAWLAWDRRHVLEGLVLRSVSQPLNAAPSQLPQPASQEKPQLPLAQVLAVPCAGSVQGAGE